MNGSRFSGKIAALVIGIAIVVAAVAYVLRDVSSSGSTHQVQQSIGTTGNQNR